MPQSNTGNFVSDLSQMYDQRGKKGNLADLGIVQNPALVSMLSKLIQPKEKQRNSVTTDSSASNTIFPGVDQISKQLMGRAEDSENAFKLFPDLELAAQIIISSLLSPKDMVKSKLNYRLEGSVLPTHAASEILEILRDEITQNYHLEDKLYEIIRNALFRNGSHPVVILPEAAVDDVINKGAIIATESINAMDLFVNGDLAKVRSMGILGNPHESNKAVTALESLFTPGPEAKRYDERLYVDNNSLPVDEDIEVGNLASLMQKSTSVVDNFHILKLPDVLEISRNQKIASLSKSRLAMVAEAADDKTKNKVTPGRLYEMLYKNAPTDYTPYSVIPGSVNLRRRSVGRPLVIHVAAEALIPVFIPGDSSNHIGYFLAVDVDGNPITLDSTVTEFGQSLSSGNTGDRSGSSASGLLTERARRNLISDNFTPMIDRMSEIHAEIVEKDLLERLSRGIYASTELSIGKNTDLSRIMLARGWKGRSTRLVYTPAEYVTYFAFNYHRNGVGRSYIDDLSNIISMRAMVLFSKIWAMVRSSISTIKTNITFDPRDPDPVKTIETVKHLVAKSRQQYFPNGLRSVQDFTDWIHKAGIMVTWDNHPRLPNTHLDFEAKNVEHVMPNDELEELLRHMCYMHFGLAPETVDSAAKADFATTVQNNSILFSRRILMLGKTLSKHLSSVVQKIAGSDSVIIDKILVVLNTHAEAITANFTEEEKAEFENNNVAFSKFLVNDTLNRLIVSVPEPDTTVTVNQKTEIESYSDLIDKVLDSIISPDILPEDLAGSASEHIGTLRNAWKGELMRRFYAENNITPEAFEIASRNEDGKPLIDLNSIVKTHSENIMAATVDLLKRMKPVINAGDSDLQNLDAGTGADGGGGDSGGDTSTDENSEDDFGSMDDGMSIDDTVDETQPPEEDTGEPAEDEAESESTPEEEPEA